MIHTLIRKNSLMLKDRVAIITGSSRGIGRRIAEVFAANHANVVVNYNQSDQAAVDTSESIRSQTGQSPLLVKADVSTAEGVDRLFDSTINRFGKVDILVNNAGITIRGALADITSEMWDRVMNVNLKGTFLCCQAAANSMKKQKKGNIINIASVRGISGSQSSAHYAVSKAGVIALTKSLALELAPEIRVNVIAPGYVETDLHAHLDSAAIQKIETNIPLHRFGTVEELAQTALFLASDNSGYITGTTIVASGGMVIL